MGSYLRPTDLGEALEALATGGHAGVPWVVVAGATDHYPSRVGPERDEAILDISAIAGLREIRPEPGAWRIPALATWADLSERPLAPCFDGLRRAARAIGGPQVQNRGTVCGNVCNASPAADALPNLLALDASVELASVRGTRNTPLAEFVTGNRRTTRAPDEIVTAILVPAPSRPTRSTFLKLGARAYLVISIVSVAGVLELDSAGRVGSIRLAVGACAPVARRLGALEAELAGRPVSAELAQVVRPDHLAGLSPIDDVRGTAAYRLEAAEVMVRRAIRELAA